MPKLLFLAYAFPPSPAIGAVRAWSMAKYLARLGWDITVVTPRPGAGFSAEALSRVDQDCRQEGIARLFAGRQVWLNPNATLSGQPGAWLRQYPTRVFGRLGRALGIGWDEVWAGACYRRLARIKPGSVDLVLATGSPFSSFVVARWVARKLGVPYVLDYRDPWSLNTLSSRPWPTLVRRLERAILRDAALTLMVSPSQAAAQAQAFGMVKPPLVITNGYDPEQLAGVTARPFDDFALVYAGEFYTGQREIDPVLLALKRVRVMMPATRLPIRLHYYGGSAQQVQAKSRHYGVEDLVACHGRVSREEALAAIKASDITVVIAGIADTANQIERGIVTGKLFEPLGLGKRILLIAPAGNDAVPMVEESGAGKSFKASETDAMADWLIECASQEGYQGYSPPVNYAWTALARTLDDCLTGCLHPDGQSSEKRFPSQ